MSLTVPDDGGHPPAHPDQRETGPIEAAVIEERLASLADEMARLIESGPRAERETLHAYAVGLLRERDPWAESFGGAAVEDGIELETSEAGSNSSGATLLGYGFLLLPAGGILLLVFPPVGGLLLASGLVMMCGGLVAALLGRLAATVSKRA